MKKEQLLRGAKLSFGVKNKINWGGNEGSPLSSFNEKTENCFCCELPGLIEAQGSGQGGYQFPRPAGSAGRSSR